MRLQLVFVLLLFTTLQLALAQRGGGWQNAVLGALLDQMQSREPRTRQCTPFQLPVGFKNYQDYCKSLSIASDEAYNQMYRDAPPPMGESFSLQGCVLGCIVGKNSYERGLRWGSGAWSGKCIRNSNIVNLLSPLPPFGMMNVLDTFNWSRMLPVTEQFPGQLSQGISWWEALNGFRSGGNVKNSWIITYDETVVPTPTPGNALSNVTSFVVKGTRDELRQVSPGMFVGKVYQRPGSSINPLPIPVDTGITFALFQVCDRNFNFPNGGNQRALG